MISVIIPSYLGNYPGSADKRSARLHRAIKSVLSQTYTDFEILLISDGCDLTREVYGAYQDERLHGFYIPKQPTWSGKVRNVGLDKAQGQIICYLDSDDFFGENHLKHIAEHFDTDKYEWAFFNDLTPVADHFIERKCKLSAGRCGVSNIAHVPIPDRWYDRNSYGYDDWNYIRLLMRRKLQYIPAAEYCVCHIPQKYQV